MIPACKAEIRWEKSLQKRCRMKCSFKSMDQKEIGKQIYRRLTSEWLEQTLSAGKCLHITHQSLLRIYKPETIV